MRGTGLFFRHFSLGASTFTDRRYRWAFPLGWRSSNNVSIFGVGRRDEDSQKIGQAAEAASPSDNYRSVPYFNGVSAAEIIDELSRLSEAEVRLVRQRLIELAAQNEDVGLCDQAALEGAAMLDRLEAEDAAG